jgi:hypothetical protein
VCIVGCLSAAALYGGAVCEAESVEARLCLPADEEVRGFGREAEERTWEGFSESCYASHGGSKTWSSSSSLALEAKALSCVGIK